MWVCKKPPPNNGLWISMSDLQTGGVVRWPPYLSQLLSPILPQVDKVWWSSGQCTYSVETRQGEKSSKIIKIIKNTWFSQFGRNLPAIVILEKKQTLFKYRTSTQQLKRLGMWNLCIFYTYTYAWSSISVEAWLPLVAEYKVSDYSIYFWVPKAVYPVWNHIYAHGSETMTSLPTAWPP